MACSEGCHRGLQLRRFGAPRTMPTTSTAARSMGSHARTAAVLAVMTAARRRRGPFLRGRSRREVAAPCGGRSAQPASQQKQNAQLTRAWWRRMEPQAATGRGPAARLVEGDRREWPAWRWSAIMARFTPSSARKAFAVLSPYVRRSHVRTLRTSAAVSQQCEVTQVKVAVTSPDHVGTVTAAPTGPFPGS